MKQFLNYYEFTDFQTDQSQFFGKISYTHIKEDYFLIIELKENIYHVHLTTYNSKNDIGKSKPTGLNTLIDDFQLDNNNHRKLIQQYLDYN